MSKVLDIALSQYGVNEFVGKLHNPEVLKYFRETGHQWVQTDETPWCSAFANWVAKKANAEYSGQLNARSWLEVGKPTETPIKGDIVVLWREKKSSWKGHVGFFINETDDFINILGGNQYNRVTIRAYSKKRLLGFRQIEL